MADQQVTRYDDHVIVAVAETRDSESGSQLAVLSFATRSPDGQTLALTRDGALARVDDTAIVVSVSGARPASVVSVNTKHFLVDSTGRAVISIDNSDQVSVRFEIGTSQHVMTLPTQRYSQSLLSGDQSFVLLVLMAFAAAGACLAPNTKRSRYRRLRTTVHRKHKDYASR